jgi:hypothetical protein
MRRFVLTLAFAALAAPAATAQDVEPEPEGPGLFERGADLMMRGLLEQLGPFVNDLESAMVVLGGVVERLGGYEAPEILPNGDILIRRRPGGEGAEPPVAPSDPSLQTPQEEGEVEL